MKFLLPSTVMLLMVSVGMSLNWTQFLANWRRLTLSTWGKLLAATFIIPPILALALASLLRLDRGALVYDPRSYLALSETAMAERVKQAVSDLRGDGKTMFAS